MAILTQGILGPVVGNTGPVVSYIRFRQNITRSMSDSRKNRIETPKRKTQRQKIKVCNEFTKAFSGDASECALDAPDAGSAFTLGPYLCTLSLITDRTVDIINNQRCTPPAVPITVARALRKLGHDIRNARRRRRIPVAILAERASISRMTLNKIDKEWSSAWPM